MQGSQRLCSQVPLQNSGGQCQVQATNSATGEAGGNPGALEESQLKPVVTRVWSEDE